MPKKSFVKKKQFMKKCREQVKNGFVNNAEGQWVKADSSKAMHRDMVAGYHFNR